MVIATRPSATAITIHRGDVRTVQRDRSWDQFESLQQGFENSRGVRLFYYDGVVEILMPGIDHELFKTVIGILIEAFLLDREIEFVPTGSMTQQIKGLAAAEADESYQIDGYRLSIELCSGCANEINFTSGDESKLNCYQLLGVNEVWLWEDGVLACYHLQSTGYQKFESSQIPALGSIDFAVLAECILIGETSRVGAVKRFRSQHPINQ
jgi:Uma2 family endonuclease